MIDVKKLTVGFLILAVGGALSALLISNIGSVSATNETATVTATNTTSSNPIGDNAFFPVQSAQDTENDLLADNSLDDPDISTTTDAISNDPNNLTNILENSYMDGLVSANPTGPQINDGNPTLTSPDPDSVISQFEASSTALQNFQVPDWNFEASQVPIILGTTSSSDALTAYSNAVQGIITNDFIQTNLESMLNDNTDPSAAPYVATQFQNALKDISGLQTPPSAVAFQKSLVKLLVYEKNVALVAENINVDPLKSSLILQGETPQYDQALQDFGTQLQKTLSVKGFSFFATTASPSETNTTGIALINSLLGIQTAHAQWITFDPNALAQQLLVYANNIALQILKNLITQLMQKTVLRWIQGNGVPRFIQSWGTTLVNAYTQTALNTLNGQMQCVNSAPFAAKLRLTLTAFYQPNTNVCAVQFQSQLGNNLTKFYNNFASGGWLTFGSSMQPSNNYYGSVFFTAQTIAQTAQGQQNAVQAKSISNNGWNGSAVCDDGSNPNGVRLTCQDGSNPNAAGMCDAGQQLLCEGGTLLDIDAGTCPDGTQPTLGDAAGTPAVPVPNAGQCADGSEPEITNPGAVTGQVFNTSVDATGKLTTAANDIAGLLDAFLTSLLNSLATNAITAANGVIQQIPAAGGGGAAAPAAPVAPVNTPVALQCNVTPDALAPAGTFELNAVGGEVINGTTGVATTPQYTWTAPGSTPAAGAGANFQVTYPAPGTYNIALNDTVDNVTTNCTATF